jgi:hypothetical protein
LGKTAAPCYSVISFCHFVNGLNLVKKNPRRNDGG